MHQPNPGQGVPRHGAFGTPHPPHQPWGPQSPSGWPPGGSLPPYPPRGPPRPPRKQYIQLDVTVTPQDSRQPGAPTRLGVGFLNAAFAQTGLNPNEYPYSIDISGGEGREMRYFIDPTTLLPAYQVMKATNPINLDGTPAGAADSSGYSLYEYAYPAQFDDSLNKAEGTPRTTFTTPPFDQVTLP